MYFSTDANSGSKVLTASIVSAGRGNMLNDLKLTPIKSPASADPQADTWQGLLQQRQEVENLKEQESIKKRHRLFKQRS
eukprot:COSAG05_NODE_14121_length_407_cov_0.996753_1_plen_78_part_01